MTENYPPAATPSQRGESPPPVLAEEQGTADVVRIRLLTWVTAASRQGSTWPMLPGIRLRAWRRRPGARAGTCSIRLKASWRSKRPRDSSGWWIGCFRSVMSSARWQMPPAGGMPADLAHQVASRARDAGQWLGDRKPGQVMDEMQSFARRRPGVFLALAAGAGLVAGRLTRGLKDASSNDSAATAAPARYAGLGRRWPEPSDVAGSTAGNGGASDERWAFLPRQAACRPPAVTRPGRPARRRPAEPPGER